MDNDTLDQFLVNYSPENVYDFATNGDIDNLTLALNVGDNSTNWLWEQRDDEYGHELLVALHRAAENGHLECVEVLLNCGADISSKTSWSEKSPLHLAARNGHLSIVALLIERGANINSDTRYYDTENGYFGKAIAAAAFSDHEDVTVMLYDEGSTGLEDALCAAASNGSLNCMDFLLDVGVDVNSPDRQDMTPLIIAACNNELDSIERLLMRGANVNLMCNGESALMRAAQNGCIDVCRFLLDNNADIDDNIDNYTNRPNFPGDCIPMILEEIENRRKKAVLNSFIDHHIEYPPYKNRIFSICYSDGNIQITEPDIGWPRAEKVLAKYYFDEIFFYLRLYVGKITTKSTSDRFNSITALARNSNATSTLMTVLVDRLKLYLHPAAL